MASDQTVHLSGLHSSDAEPLSRIHMLAFPDFFLSRLGHTFLKEFYRGFLGEDDVVAVVARDSQGRPVGQDVRRPPQFHLRGAGQTRYRAWLTTTH